MAYYPCLEKSYIKNFLNEENKHNCGNDRKTHVNSDVMNKYIEIKRQRELKVSQILPKYQIFPKSFSNYNIYTINHDIDRLQRMKNSQNQKYYQQQDLRRPNSSKSQEKENVYFDTSNSKLILSRKNEQNLEKKSQSKSVIKFYHNKSSKSLAQTNVEPSRISKNFNTKIQSKVYVQSDSQSSSKHFQNYQSTNKGIHSDKKSFKNGDRKMQESKFCRNTQSQISIKTRLLCKTKNQYKDGKEKNAKNQQKQLSSQNQLQKQEHLSDKQSQQIVGEQKRKYNVRFRESLENQSQNQQKHRSNEQYLHSYNQKTQIQNVYSSECSEIDKKIFDYYGDQFARIKAQRDYLRKHFIQHLQSKHTSQLPYNKLTSFDFIENGEKMIIHTQRIPTKNHEKVSQTVQLVKYAQSIDN